jgi:hypothetical protein
LLGKIRGLLARLKRRHPDIYGVLRRYCDERGVSIEDVAASAVATWLASDEEARKDLEQAMAARAAGVASSGAANIRETIGMFKDMCGAMAEMFRAMAEVRSSLSITSIIDEYRALSTAAKEIKSIGESGGAGSLDQLIAQIFLQRMLGGVPTQTKPLGKKKTGTAEIERIEEE